MAEADAKLLFGVAMAGDAEGDSAKQIQEDLKKIIDDINEHHRPTIKIGLKPVGGESGGNKSWNAIIKDKLKTLSNSDKFSVKISKIEISGSAIADFKKQLRDVISTLTLDKSVNVTLGAPVGNVSGDTKQVKQDTKAAGDEAVEAAKKMAVFNEELRTLTRLQNQMRSGTDKLRDLGVGEKDQAELQGVIARYNEWIQKIAEVKTKKQFDDGQLEALRAEGAAIQNSINALHARARAAEEAAHATEVDSTTIDKNVKLLAQARANQQKWTAAKSGDSSKYYNAYKQAADDLEAWNNKARMGTTTAKEYAAGVEDARRRLVANEAAIRANGDATKSWSDKLGGLAKKFASWFSVSQIIMKIVQAIRQMVRAVIDLDTAMTELKKVTNETTTTYNRFLDDAAERAKKLGATFTDVVNATADFARLGYSIKDAAMLADVATVYKNVGDGIENIGDASESVIATMQAFGISAQDAMSIVDKFNEVGNNFAISSKGVGDALLRSASAMHAAGNDLDETIALATAANTIVQSPEKVGTTLKTISMFLRSAKTELEDAGESTEGMAESVSKLRKNILLLTDSRVDIQKDADTYKSTYEILKDLSEVWGDLTDVTRANILEMIGGKRNANVTAALLENFDLVEKVLEKSRNSADSAMKENEKYLNSIQGHINQLKATFQDVSRNLIDSDFVKGVVDLGKGLLNILNLIAKLVKYVGGLKTVLVAVVGVIMALHAKRIMAKIEQAPNAIMNIARAIQAMGQRASSANAIMLALTAAITIFLVVQNRVYETRQQNIDSMNEAAAKANEERKSLDQLIDSYEKLAKKGIESDDDRAEALNIQEQITELVGKQADNLDLVNGKLEEELGILRGISKEEASRQRGAIETKMLSAESDLQAGLWSKDQGTWLNQAKDYVLGTSPITSWMPSVQEAMTEAYIEDMLIAPGEKYNYGLEHRLAGLSGREQLAFLEDVQRRLLSDRSWADASTNRYGEDIDANAVLQTLQTQISYLRELADAADEAYRSMAQIELAGVTFESKEEFDAWVKSVKFSTDKTEEYKDILIKTAEEAFPQFTEAAIKAQAASERQAERAAEAAKREAERFKNNHPLEFLSQQFTGVEGEFEGIADAIDSVREAMEPLTKLQEEVADGFTMSIDKALEFAKVYPQILEGAQIAADGQITLNEAVVNAFIEGKKAELGAALDEKIQILESEREAYEKKLYLAEAELAYLKTAAENRILINKADTDAAVAGVQFEAEMRISAGETASEAYRIASENMQKRMAEFSTESLDDSADIAEAFNAAAMAVDSDVAEMISRGQSRLIALTRQAHEAAKAIAGVGRGDWNAGSEERVTGSVVGGIFNAGKRAVERIKSIKEDVLDGITEALKPDDNKPFYDLREGMEIDKESQAYRDTMYEELLRQIDITSDRIDSYKQAIAVIDGQIATLRAAKEIGFTTTGGSTSGGSSGGSSSSSSDKELDRLKSIVSLLESELKIMEAQDAPAQDRIDKIREIQAALMDEINYLKSIGADQETINNLTLQWLNYNKEIDDIYQDTADKAKSALDELVQYRVKMLQDELKRQKENLDKQLDALKEFYDKQKQLLRDQYDEDKYLDQQAEKRKKVADIEAQLEQLRYDDSAWAQKRRAELEAELADARKELDDFEKEHALDMTEKMLDDQYEAQAKEIEKEKDLIDEQLDDEEGLYQQAFNDILAGGEDLYKALLDWNKKYGDHIDETITTAWHNAAKALQDYKDLYGEDYEGVQLTDVTGTSESGSGKPGGGTPSGGSHTTTPSDSGQDKTGGSGAAVTDDVKRQVAAAIWNGSYGWGSGADRAKKLKEVFGDNNGIQALVNKGVGRNGPAPSRDFTYLNMRKKFRGYATGTRSALPGWHAIDENGSEMIFETADGSRYKLFGGGEKVLNANASNFLYDFANGGKKVLADLLRVVVNPGIGGITDPRRQISINAGDIIIQGNADKATVSEIRRARRESMDYILKEFDRLSR